MTSPKYSIVKLPCKPYIKKFATALFGDPITVDSKTSLGIIITFSLQKNVYENRNIRDEYYEQFMRKRPALLDVSLNEWFFEKIGHDFPRSGMMTINRFLENTFDEFLYMYVSTHIDAGVRYSGVENSIMAFAEQYGFVVGIDPEDESDITIDALKKKVNRFKQRKIKKNKSCYVVPSISAA